MTTIFSTLCITLLLLASNASAQPVTAQVPSSLQDKFKEATKLYADFKDEEALAKITEYLLRERDDQSAMLLRVLCLRNLLRYADIVEDLKDRNDLALPLRLQFLESQALTVQGGIEKSLEQLAAIISDEPDAPEPKLTRARLLMLQNKSDQALSELQDLRRGQPRMIEPVLLMAQLMEHRARFPEAAQLYFSMLNNPTTKAFDQHDRHLDREAVLGLARVNVQTGKYDMAIDLYQQIRTQDPANANAIFMIGICEGMMNRMEDSIRDIKIAIEMAPTVLEYRLRLGDIYRATTRWPEAIEQFEAAIDKATDKTLPAMRLAEAYLEIGKLDKARVDAELAESLQPKSADVQEIVGRVKEKLGDPAGAMKAYRTSFETNPIKYEAMYRLAVLLARSDVEVEQSEGRLLLERYRRLEQYLPEIQRIKSEADLSPRNPQLHWRMGGVLNVAGEYEHAMAWARRALAIDPNFVQAIGLVGMISANVGNDADAMQAFERVQEILKRNGQAAGDAEIQGWIDLLKKGEKLPLPLGKLVRPGRTESPLPAGDGQTPVRKDG